MRYAGEDNALFLLAIAESANPPNECTDGECGDFELPAKNGWNVVFFYDVGDLDYIDHFITPEGEVVDFWDWPQGTLGRELLINWRGVGDLESLQKTLDQKEDR